MSVESLISATESLAASEPISVLSVEVAIGTANLFAAVEEPQANLNKTNAVEKHAEFFFELIYFQVENKLYGIPEAMLPGSGYMSSATGVSKGRSENDPMVLNVTVSQMDSLMLVLTAGHVHSPPDLTIGQWSDALGLATHWRLDAARNFVIDHITRNLPNHIADRIKLADAYGVEKWLHPAYETICTRPTPPTEDEIVALGPKRLAALYGIREATRQPQMKYLVAKCSTCGKACMLEEEVMSPRPRFYCCGTWLAEPEPSQNPRTPVHSAPQLIRTSIVLNPPPPGDAGKIGDPEVSPMDVSLEAETVAQQLEVGEVRKCDHTFVCVPEMFLKPQSKVKRARCKRSCSSCGIKE